MRRHMDSKAKLYDFPKIYAGVMRLVKKFDAAQIHAVFAADLRAAWPPNLRDAEARWKVYDARWENAGSAVVWPERRLYSYPDAG